MKKSIRWRFIASFFGNLTRSGLSFFTGLFLARFMGPTEYGRMTFLLTSFIAFRQFIDMGSSTAFFTFLSQRKRSPKFLKIFWSWVCIQFLFSLSAIAWVFPEWFLRMVWMGESRSTLILAFVATFMQGHVWNLASQMAEASRETIRLQMLNLIVVLSHIVVIFLLWWLQELAIHFIFVSLTIEWFLASWLATKLYYSKADELNPEFFDNDNDTVISVWNEFYKYCLPLLFYSWLSFIHDFADRWMLQNWGGAKEQAYYGVAQQFSIIALIATSSILRIFWKEIAEANHQGNRDRVKFLYSKISRILYFVGAFFCGLLMPWTGEILKVTVGEAYINGKFTLMLMFLYPVHQSIGQVAGTMLYATGQIKAQVTLGMIFMVLSLAVSYFTMAPESAFIAGLGLASQGLSWKMIVIQILGVNATAWYVARFFNWKFEWFYQVMGLSGCIFAGWFSYYFTISLLSGIIPVFIQMLISSIMHFCLVVFLLYISPWLVGMSREELSGFATNFIFKLKSLSIIKINKIRD